MVKTSLTLVFLFLVVAPGALSSRVSCLMSVPDSYVVEESARAQQEDKSMRIHMNFERVQVGGQNEKVAFMNFIF